MERQEHCPKLQNLNDAFLDYFNLPVRVRNMDPYRGVREEDTCYRRLHGISYRDHVTNEEVRNTIRHIIEDLITTVRKRKLRLYGHITR